MADRVNIKAHASQLSLAKVDSNVLLELFPFAIILDHDMHISKCGEKLLETWILQNPNKKPSTFFTSVATKHLKLRRPKGIAFNWQTVCLMHTVIFELELIRSENPNVTEVDLDESLTEIAKNMELKECENIAAEDIPDQAGGGGDCLRGTQGNYRLLLKGQMRYIQDIDRIVFLCSPV